MTAMDRWILGGAVFGGLLSIVLMFGPILKWDPKYSPGMILFGAALFTQAIGAVLMVLIPRGAFSNVVQITFLVLTLSLVLSAFRFDRRHLRNNDRKTGN